jgi:hypothetical protein
MKKYPILLILLAPGCGALDPSGSNQSAAAGKGAPESPTDLTGLYQGRRAEPADQLCLVGRGRDKARFGLVIWGSNLHSCSGAGEAVRSGDRLTLSMAGDSPCRIEARISGGTIAFPAAMPAGCSYYCGARARLDGAAFTRIGATKADAMKAKDLAGDSLCGGEG